MLLALSACSQHPVLQRSTSEHIKPQPPGVALRALARRVDLTLLEDRELSWRLPLPAAELRGLRLLYDTPLPAGSTLAIVRSAARANHRLDPFDALVFATRAASVARAHRLDPEFFGSVLLQESAFTPDAVSAAGAVGIAQFTMSTADAEGVDDPFDWADAMRGCARLLGRYVNAYDGVYPDPYAAALAAYNAGPGTVAYYHGVPPYPETKTYVGDIYDRWSRILRDATGVARPRKAVQTSSKGGMVLRATWPTAAPPKAVLPR